MDDPASAGMPDAFGDAAQPWPTIYLGHSIRFRVRFKVPGLRWDGTAKGDHPVRRLVTKLPVRVLLFVADLVSVLVSIGYLVLVFGALLILDLISELISGGVIDTEEAMDRRNADGWLRRSQRVIVVRAGSPVADAVTAGRALTHGRGRVCLVTSSRDMTFLQVVGGRQEVLWTGTVPNRPDFAPSARELRWADGSTVELRWPKQ